MFISSKEAKDIPNNAQRFRENLERIWQKMFHKCEKSGKKDKNKVKAEVWIWWLDSSF
ncbi:hypothetical protein [Helicobacter sp. T3_23-1056]